MTWQFQKRRKNYMKKIFTHSALIILFFSVSVSAQYRSDLKLKENSGIFSQNRDIVKHNSFGSLAQLKKRSTVTSYVGAGYSFVIFTAHDMNTGYPVFDLQSGDFLSEINLYYGFAIAQALTLEIEPSILFTRNNRGITIIPASPVHVFDTSYNYVLPQTLSMIAFPIALNIRFFPAFKSKGFGRLFFVGGGAGVVWIREEYDVVYSNSPAYGYYNGFYSNIFTVSTSQWSPLFRVMTGFTGTGGQFGFGGEVRYNFVPLKRNDEAFLTRIAPNFNSVELSLRFYFSL